MAAIGLLIALPFGLLIAIAIYIETPGSVIFSQTRLGLHGKYFKMHKFRKFPLNWKTAGPGVTVSGDARMTRVGKLLERSKLDELPQLWNILVGEMSFVGPRPESTRYEDLFTGHYRQVLNYLPGIFGPNQIAYRNESELYPADEDAEEFYRRELFPKKADNDITYFREATVLKDIKQIGQGIFVSLIGTINWVGFIRENKTLLFMDIVLTNLAWFIANIFCFSGFPVASNSTIFYHGLWLFPLLVISGKFIGRCYMSIKRYFSLKDALHQAAVISTVLLIGFGLLHYNIGSFQWLPLMPMYWFLLVSLLTAPYMLHRMRFEKQHILSIEQPRNILIYGANRKGVALAHWLHHGLVKSSLLGFLDDKPKLRGRRVFNYQVMGRESDIPTLHEVHCINEIWLMFSPNSDKRERLKKVCSKLDIHLVYLPSDIPVMLDRRIPGDRRVHKESTALNNIRKKDRRNTNQFPPQNSEPHESI